MKYGLLIAIVSFCLTTFFVFSKNTKISKAGEQYIYTWESKTVAYTDIQHLYQAEDTNTLVSFFNRNSLQSFQISINGIIKKTVISRDDKGEIASYQIINPAIEVKQAGQTLNCELLQKELTHPVFVESSPQGLMKMVRVDTAVNNFSADMIKGILSRLQFVRSAERAREWQTVEESPSGVYKAKYHQVKSNSSGSEFEKKNEGYIKLKLPGQNQRIADNGKINISTDTAGTVVGINAEERQVVRFSDDTVSLSTSVISVKLQSTSWVSNEDLKPLKKLIRSPNYNDQSTLGEALPEYKVNRPIYTETLGNDNLASLMGALNLRDEKEEENLILKFRALAYLFPNHCEDLGRILKKEPLESYTFRVLSSALANAETEIALNALVSVIDARRAEEKIMIELFPTLATSKTPTEQAISIATQIAFSPASTPDVASTAQLTLGALAYNLKKTLKKTDEKRSVQITAFLLDTLREEKDTIQKIMVLANTGSATILPILKIYLEHPGISKEVQMEAISGLRLMNDSSSVNYLNKLVNSKDTLIVKKAKEVIAFKKEQL